MFVAILVTVLSLGSYVVAVLLTYLQKDFSLRWFAFGLSIVPVILTGGLVAYQLLKNKIRMFPLRDLKPRENMVSFALFVTVASVAITLRFLFLKEYPFVSVGDEVRDGGLHAFEIATGLRKEIFAYGVYESHGLIIATLVSFLFRIFQHTVYTFRLATLIVGVADVLLVYVFVHKVLNKWAAFFAALILACLPIHLFYSRSEIVVIFSSFWTTAILISLYFMISRKTAPFILWTATILGFAAGFHTSIRTVVFVACSIAPISLGIWLLQSIAQRKFCILRLFHTIAFALFFFIGFGPRILYTPPNIFFQSRSLNIASTEADFQENEQEKVIKIATNLEKKYMDSFLVYLQNPTLSHYPEHQPVLPPLLAIFFVIGLVVTALVLEAKIWKIVALFAFLVPFTNSAITEAVNNDHRLAPMFVLASIVSGVGVWFVLSRSKESRLLQWLLGGIIALYILLQGSLFFINQPASKERYVREYLGMHLIYLLQEKETLYRNNYVCLRVQSGMAEYLNFIHVREQFEYFIPKLQYDVVADNEVKANEVFILPNCMDSSASYQTFKISCSKPFDFRCPVTEPQYKEFIFHVARY